MGEGAVRFPDRSALRAVSNRSLTDDLVPPQYRAVRRRF